MAQSILYKNASISVTVLDIPRSIAHGQDTSAWLVSCPAPDVPYASTEPKGARREKLLSEIPEAERAWYHEIHDLLLGALCEARISVGDRPWCYQRREGPAEVAQLALDNKELPSQVLNPPLFLSGIEDRVCDFSILRNSLIVNALSSRTTLAVDTDLFHVPSRSAFICSTVASGMPLFHLAMKSRLLFTAATDRVPDFDLLLLDPPWTNRSVRHAKAYRTAENQRDPFEEVLPIISSYLAPDGIVAIWITNKTAVRSQVLRAMEDLGVRLFEEWIWLKVTKQGKPVTELDGIWRRPYEILLLFKRPSLPPLPRSGVGRRVIIAVPDLHSRKPCLKELIEPLLPHPYRALELFARNLTLGWWSWGDECLRFQHANQWTGAPS